MGKTVSINQIDTIMDNSEFVVFHKVFDKQCIVVAKLPNGFTVVGESACVDPTMYDEAIGEALAKKNIVNRLWELEGYLLQQEVYMDKASENLNSMVE